MLEPSWSEMPFILLTSSCVQSLFTWAGSGVWCGSCTELRMLPRPFPTRGFPPTSQTGKQRHSQTTRYHHHFSLQRTGWDGQRGQVKSCFLLPELSP